ncbi:hypothetical protein [Corynebacterium atrinae]|uniref:hypothetical protein n=1 Tax=Corynebacterium atrinae TaxID=1336740 RepID=UPI0025B2C6E2|nr:hypothetical protein [Corynebacterium atrinae]
MTNTPSAPFTAFRRRVIGWFIALVAITLIALILTTRTVLQSGVAESANEDVAQEIEEFFTFTNEGLDPETAAPFDSPDRLLQVFLSRQIPHPDEALVGVVDGQLMQTDLGPRPLLAGEPLVEAATSSPQTSGVFQDEQRGAVHWGRVAIAGTESSLVVARFTDTDTAAVNATLRAMLFTGLGALVLASALAWVVARRIHDEAVFALHQRIDAADAAHRGILTRASRQSEPSSAVLAALAGIPPGVRGDHGATAPVAAEVVVGDVVTRIPEACLVGPLPKATLAVDRELVALALSECARFFDAPPEVSASIHDAQLRISLSGPARLEPGALEGLFEWQPADHDGGELAGVLLRAVTDHHGGRAWAESPSGAGISLGVDLPLVKVAS